MRIAIPTTTMAIQKSATAENEFRGSKHPPTYAGADGDNRASGSSGKVTYYVAMPFLRDDQGDLVAGEPAECQSSRSAVGSAQAMALVYGGAVAFSRSGDPAVGEFDDAVVLAAVGDVPADLSGLAK